MIIDDVISWLNEHDVDGHSIVRFDEGFVSSCPLEVTIAGNLVNFESDTNSYQMHATKWEHQLDALKHGKTPFCIVRPDKETDKPEYRYYSNDKPVRTYDENGDPKVSRGTMIYAIVKYHEQVPWGIGTLWDTPENRNSLWSDGEGLIYALCKLFGAETPSAMGRGFYFSEGIRNLRKVAENV